MEWWEILIAIIGSGGVGALIATIANVIQNRRKSVSEQKGSQIEHSKETLYLVDELLQKQLKWMAERMDSGDAVRQQEISELRDGINKRFDCIEVENTKQNSLLADIVEYLNGDFQQFELDKQKKVKRLIKKRN